MDDKLRAEMRDYAWKYFELHADQRIKTFNFFLILCVFIGGGLIAMLKDTQGSTICAVPAFSLSFISFIFWRLDVRNKHLVQHAQEALKVLENDDRLPDETAIPHRLKLFSHEEYLGIRERQRRILRFIPTYYSYSTCFRAVFAVFALAGFSAGIAELVW